MGSVLRHLIGSIGFAFAATLGAEVARVERKTPGRTILCTGDGSMALTIQEIGTMVKAGIKPVIFVINNAGYTVERLIWGARQRKFITFFSNSSRQNPHLLTHRQHTTTLPPPPTPIFFPSTRTLHLLHPSTGLLRKPNSPQSCPIPPFATQSTCSWLNLCWTRWTRRGVWGACWRGVARSMGSI